MSIKIHVIYGATDEYSDHREWPVKAFRDEQKTKDYIIALTEAGNKIVAAADNPWSTDVVMRAHPDWVLDPAFENNRSGFNYAYWTIDLED